MDVFAVTNNTEMKVDLPEPAIPRIMMQIGDFCTSGVVFIGSIIILWRIMNDHT